MSNTDTELSLGFNLSQAEKDIKEIPEIIKNALKKIEGKGLGDLEKKLTDSLNRTQELDKSLGEAAGEMDKLARSSKELETLKELKVPVADEIKGAETAMARLQKAWNSNWRMSPDAAGAVKNRAEYQKWADDLARNKQLMSELDAEEVRLNTEIEASVNKVNSVVQASTNWKDSVATLVGETDAEVAKLEQAKQAEAELASDAKDVASATGNINDTLDGAAGSAGELAGEIKETSEAAANSGLNEMGAEANETNEGIVSLLGTIAGLRSKIAGIRGEGRNIQEAFSGLSDAAKHFQELKEAQADSDNSGNITAMAQAYGTVLTDVERVRQAIIRYKEEVKQTSDSHKKAASSGKRFGIDVGVAINTVKAGMRGINNILTSVKRGFSSLSKVSGKIKSSFNGMTKSMQSNFKHLLVSLTKYVFGFRSLFFLVRRLRKYIGEGIQNMARFNDGNNHVNDSITRLLSSLLFLKNAWATAFSPILQFVTTWLSMFIDKLAEVGNAISRFLGRLMGTVTVFQAVKVDASDYAESLDGVGSSAKGAADKTKKLTDRLAAFDDLNVLGKDNDNDGTGSGGGGGADEIYTPDPNEMFKIVDVASDVKDQLLDMWKNSDFSSLGEIVRDKLVDAISNINWSGIQEVAYKIGKSIATFLNGALGDPALWVETGNALAQGLNTISQFAFGLLSNNNVDWGGNFAKFISSWFNNIDWPTVEANIKMLADTLVANINSFFENLELGEGVSTLSESLTYFITTMICGIHWEEIVSALSPIGATISQGIEQALSTSDNPFLNSIGTLMGSFRAAFEQGDVSQVSSGIITFITNAISNINWSSIISTLDGFGDAILAGIQESFSSSDDVILQSIGKLVGNIREALPTLLPLLSSVFDILLQLVTAVMPVLNALLPVIADVITLLSPILQVIASVIEAISPLITDIVQAVLPVLMSVIQQIMPYFEQLITAILPVLQTLFAGLQPVLETLITAILPVVVHLLDALMPIIEIILNCVSSLLEPILQILPPILQLIGAILPPLIDFLAPIVKLLALVIDLVVSILSPILELIEPLIEMLTACLTPIFEVLGFIGDMIEAIIIPIFGALSGVVKAVLIPILKFLVLGFEAVVNVVKMVGDGINLLIGIFRLGAQTISDIFKGLVNKLLGWVEGFINFFIGGLNDAISAINTISIDVPDWVPSIGGGKFGFNLGYLNTVSIPRLAQGAVIPPNREFMAVLGDQSHGTNIEAPLDTIKQAVAEVMANNGNQEVIDLLQQLIKVVESKNLVIGDKEIGKANARFTNQQRLIRGTTF